MPSTKKAKDPVCGMSVNPSQTQFKKEFHGKEYNFCCKQCMNEFEGNPNKFAKS
jgi:YHS domain-containing protein